MSNAVALPSFDYIICGGGTAGLTLAARLTEIPTVSVAVLEAGLDRSNDTNVLAPGLLTALYGNPDYDWIYETTPQPHAENRVIGLPRGKQLGGSSAINYLAWTHASQQNIDNWGALGNANWSWATIEPYYAKSENFTAPTKRVSSDLNLSYIDPAIHGIHGEIHNAFPFEYVPTDEAWPRTYDNLGIGVASDPRDGLAVGGYTILTNIDLDSNTRSYAATTYLKSAADRPNLKVFTNALISKIETSTFHGSLTATGVRFAINGTDYSIAAKQEVLLTAGSFGSPQILELSGIGNESVLAAAGLDCVLHNPNIGENLQDHPYMPLGFDVNPGIFTLDDLANETIFNAAYAQYLANGTGPLSLVGLGGALLSIEQILPDNESGTFVRNIEEVVAHAGPYSPSLQAQYDLTLQLIRSSTGEVAQHMNTASGMSPQLANDTTKLFAATVPGNYFTILAVLEHPFSRGTVHINSSNITDHPIIDPHYLEHPADVQMLAQIALQAQNSVARTAPLSDLLRGNGTQLQYPYINLTDDNVDEQVRSLVQSEYHPVGTCSMLPREKGGVVNERFQVYGVNKLRVVDASTFPLIVRANLQTLVYAVAERAADFIKEDYHACKP